MEKISYTIETGSIEVKSMDICEDTIHDAIATVIKGIDADSYGITFIFNNRRFSISWNIRESNEMKVSVVPLDKSKKPISKEEEVEIFDFELKPYDIGAMAMDFYGLTIKNSRKRIYCDCCDSAWVDVVFDRNSIDDKYYVCTMCREAEPDRFSKPDSKHCDKILDAGN